MLADERQVTWRWLRADVLGVAFRFLEDQLLHGRVAMLQSFFFGIPVVTLSLATVVLLPVGALTQEATPLVQTRYLALTKSKHTVGQRKTW